ncbi:MAG: hypothetical protein A3E01_08895 [Gammaproteobacteria bacterium RIFCSPHIGHO2_12_FULL_63_22]|nr:MAG: hypothetical protein A3E01_08895 [Gammaproteobacteria bacterium RIFCSPHIGHO2_12_FULL_63_22]
MIGRVSSRSGSDQRRALVLGNAGFIGRHLTDAISRSESFNYIEVAGFHASNAPIPSFARALEGRVDSQLLGKCSRPDVIFWAIGGASVGDSVRNPEHDRQLSIPPLNDLLELMANQWRGSHLVFLSSAAVYGASGSEETRTDSPLLAVSPYGESKVASERMIGESLEDSEYTLVRPFSVYGPGLRRQLIWEALAKLASGDLVFFGTGDEMRDWVHVNDLVQLLVQIGVRTDGFPRILNAGTGLGTSVRDVLGLLFQIAGSSSQPTFAGTKRIGDPDRLVACPREQAPLTGYLKTTLNAGLRDYVRWHASLHRP